MPKILIADDSIAVRKVAERLLAEAGMGVVLAANGEEALAYLKKDCPDVIVSDVIMPDKSGYEVCAFVRATAALAATPVLLISGIVNDEVTKQAETCKADGVLKKPFQGTTLKDKVLELLAKRQKPIQAPESKSTSSPAAAPTIGSKSMSVPQQAAAQAPASGLKLMPTHAPPPQSDADTHVEGKLREAEGRLQAEQVRAETLAKRTVELEAELGRMKGVQALLEAERRRVNELESKVETSENQASRVPQLESALKAEQEAARKARQDAMAAQALTERVAQLEAALDAERAAEAELVQQLSDMEKAAVSGARLAQRVEELENMLTEERRKSSSIGQGMEEAKARAGELEGLLAAERERNAALLRRVTESEQAALNATKRFEEMARKLGDIAGLASQLGKGVSAP
jgi:CheY-like chemotaxis protein